MARSRAASTLTRFGKNVAHYRKVKKWTQAQLAERLDCEPDYVSRIERGRENMTIVSMVRLASLLDVDVIALLGSDRK